MILINSHLLVGLLVWAVLMAEFVLVVLLIACLAVFGVVLLLSESVEYS
jgi:hypothetical protein